MDDEELLNALTEVGARLLSVAMTQADQGFGLTPDDPRWVYPVPPRIEVQLRHLFVQAADAFDLAIGGLKIRTSAVAIGAIRFLTELCALTCWLTDTTSDQEKRKRGYRLALGNIARAQGLLKKDNAEAAVISELQTSIDRVREIAREDGIQYVKEQPGADYLFKEYLEPGNILFSALSEIGSHPGFLQILVFHADRESSTIDLNISGSPEERAAWVGGAVGMFARICIRMGTEFGWEDWIEKTLMHVVREANPLIEQSRERWKEKWNLEPDSVSEEQEISQETEPREGG